MIVNYALFTADGAAGGLMSFLPSILLFLALIYFMIIRPQKKRQQSAKELMASLKVGDTIQTIGGFIGEIVEMEEDEFVILSEETKMRIKKNAVAIKINPMAPLAEPTNEKKSSKKDDDDDDFDIEDFEI